MSHLTSRDELIARYLDGMLEGDELAAFERAIPSDPELKSAVESDRRMMDRLRTVLGPPPAGQATDARPPVQQSSRSFRPPSVRLLGGIAAAVLIVVCIGIAYTSKRAANQAFATPTVEPAEVYRTAHDRGFEPAWVCEDDAQMLAYTRERFRRGMLFTPTKGVELVGWGYVPGVLSDQTAALFAEHGEHHIVLLVDRSKHDRPLEDPSVENPGLHLFRRIVGRFVLYEISPLERPVLLDAAYSVDADVMLKPGEPGPGPNARKQQ